MANDAERELIRKQQGSTLWWTEGYGTRTRGASVLEEARDILFAGALLLMAAGVAGFLSGGLGPV